MSSSDVFRTANSNAKFGAAEYARLLLAGRCEPCGAYFAPLLIDIDSLLRMVYGHRKPASEPRRC